LGEKRREYGRKLQGGRGARGTRSSLMGKNFGMGTGRQNRRYARLEKAVAGAQNVGGDRAGRKEFIGREFGRCII